MLLRKLTILEIDLNVIRFYFNLYLLFQIISLFWLLIAWTLRCIVHVARRSFEFAASRKISGQDYSSRSSISSFRCYAVGKESFDCLSSIPYVYIYIHSISIDQKWKFSSKLFKLDRKLVSRSSCHQSFARTHVRRSHNLWIALRNFHLSKQLSLRYSFESRMFASPVFIILARLADVIKRERLNIETFTNR